MWSIGLVDCNNFFVSCERVFNPKLHGKPVVVLSNNDGCIVARSQEAKKLGIPMGAPLYQWKDFFERNGVIACSSNFPLYGDLSHRVMEVIEMECPTLDIYSIDEAFVIFEGIQDPEAFSHNLRQKIYRWTGIPVSIGIASTKTLAKVAGDLAKAGNGVYTLREEERLKLLRGLPVTEIWGIGRRIGERLAKRGIRSAAQLIQQDDLWVKKTLSVTGLRTVLELRGEPALPFDELPAPKQSIMTSRTFGIAITDYQPLSEALARFTALAGEKLRKEKEQAGWLRVFIATSRHRQETYYSNYAHITLPESTSYTPRLLKAAHAGLRQIYRPGLDYKRGGVLLGDLSSETMRQTSFLSCDPEHPELMKLFDKANHKFGAPILRFASEGKAPRTKKHSSPRYTTSWSELLTIHL